MPGSDPGAGACDRRPEPPAPSGGPCVGVVDTLAGGSPGRRRNQPSAFVVADGLYVDTGAAGDLPDRQLRFVFGHGEVRRAAPAASASNPSSIVSAPGGTPIVTTS